MEDTLVKRVENDNAVLSLHYTESESPREDENLGTFYTWQSRYNSPDKHNFSEPSDFLRDLAYDFMNNTDNLHSRTDESLLNLIKKHAVILPVYKYEHGGIAYKTSPFSCPWDSGQVGWIYITKKQIRKQFGVKAVTKKYREQAENALKAEVSCYSDWANGNVYRFSLEEKVLLPEEETFELREVESCGVFYGWDFKLNGLVDEVPEEYRELALTL
jgi:hypothetical protein